MSKPKRPGTLQLAILRVPWRRREARVAEVHEALRPARALALTTIATMLRKMEDRDLVSHRLDSHTYRDDGTRHDGRGPHRIDESRARTSVKVLYAGVCHSDRPVRVRQRAGVRFGLRTDASP